MDRRFLHPSYHATNMLDRSSYSNRYDPPSNGVTTTRSNARTLGDPIPSPSVSSSSSAPGLLASFGASYPTIFTTSNMNVDDGDSLFGTPSSQLDDPCRDLLSGSGGSLLMTNMGETSSTPTWAHLDAHLGHHQDDISMMDYIATPPTPPAFRNNNNGHGSTTPTTTIPSSRARLEGDTNVGDDSILEPIDGITGPILATGEGTSSTTTGPVAQAAQAKTTGPTGNCDVLGTDHFVSVHDVRAQPVRFALVNKSTSVQPTTILDGSAEVARGLPCTANGATNGDTARCSVDPVSEDGGESVASRRNKTTSGTTDDELQQQQQVVPNSTDGGSDPPSRGGTKKTQPPRGKPTTRNRGGDKPSATNASSTQLVDTRSKTAASSTTPPSMARLIEDLQYPWEELIDTERLQARMDEMTLSSPNNKGSAHWRQLYGYVKSELAAYFYYSPERSVVIYKDATGTPQRWTKEECYRALDRMPYLKVGKTTSRSLAEFLIGRLNARSLVPGRLNAVLARTQAAQAAKSASAHGATNNSSASKKRNSKHVMDKQHKNAKSKQSTASKRRRRDEPVKNHHNTRSKSHGKNVFDLDSTTGGEEDAELDLGFAVVHHSNQTTRHRNKKDDSSSRSGGVLVTKGRRERRAKVSARREIRAIHREESESDESDDASSNHDDANDQQRDASSNTRLDHDDDDDGGDHDPEEEEPSILGNNTGTTDQRDEHDGNDPNDDDDDDDQRQEQERLVVEVVPPPPSRKRDGDGPLHKADDGRRRRSISSLLRHRDSSDGGDLDSVINIPNNSSCPSVAGPLDGPAVSDKQQPALRSIDSGAETTGGTIMAGLEPTRRKSPSPQRERPRLSLKLGGARVVTNPSETIPQQQQSVAVETTTQSPVPSPRGAAVLSDKGTRVPSDASQREQVPTHSISFPNGGGAVGPRQGDASSSAGSTTTTTTTGGNNNEIPPSGMVASSSSRPQAVYRRKAGSTSKNTTTDAVTVAIPKMLSLKRSAAPPVSSAAPPKDAVNLENPDQERGKATTPPVAKGGGQTQPPRVEITARSKSDQTVRHINRIRRSTDPFSQSPEEDEPEVDETRPGRMHNKKKQQNRPSRTTRRSNRRDQVVEQLEEEEEESNSEEDDITLSKPTRRRRSGVRAFINDEASEASSEEEEEEEEPCSDSERMQQDEESGRSSQSERHDSDSEESDEESGPEPRGSYHKKKKKLARHSRKSSYSRSKESTRGRHDKTKLHPSRSATKKRANNQDNESIRDGDTNPRPSKKARTRTDQDSIETQALPGGVIVIEEDKDEAQRAVETKQRRRIRSPTVDDDNSGGTPVGLQQPPPSGDGGTTLGTTSMTRSISIESDGIPARGASSSPHRHLEADGLESAQHDVQRQSLAEEVTLGPEPSRQEDWVSDMQQGKALEEKHAATAQEEEQPNMPPQQTNATGEQASNTTGSLQVESTRQQASESMRANPHPMDVARPPTTKPLLAVPLTSPRLIDISGDDLILPRAAPVAQEHVGASASHNGPTPRRSSATMAAARRATINMMKDRFDFLIENASECIINITLRVDPTILNECDWDDDQSNDEPQSNRQAPPP